ncbi:MAG: serine/threonine-protein kinase [Myxococcota bacterium]
MVSAPVRPFAAVRPPYLAGPMEAEPETKVIERESETKDQSALVPDALAVGKTVGRYELIHRLGHGGMATVYLGRATGRAGFEKLVAVKVIHPHLAAESEFVEMFLDEARIAARLHHPHVVEIHDLGEADGLFFMVMEYVEGETLASLLRQLRKHGERLPLTAVLRVVADACEGLAAAHDLTHADGRPMDLVHRDVSPHNLLVGMDGRVKVVDFGIAKATGRRSSTRTGQLRGKLAYMSPEQAGGDPIDHRTDLFALGTVLWELLTNERLFTADTESETLARVSACRVPDIREHCDGMPPGVVSLIERALARDRDDRFPTAAHMLRELRVQLRALDDEIDPREELSAVMERLFSARVGYIRAAVRRASTSGPRLSAANDPLSPEDVTRATARPSETSDVRVARRSTGSLPVVGNTTGTNTHTLTASLAAAPARHWSLWLLLPLVGAAVGAAMVTNGFGRDAPQPTPMVSSNPPQVTRSDGGEGPDKAKALSPEPAMIKWHFDTDPAGATITLDGKVQAQPTPVMVELPRGENAITVLVSKEGYKTFTWHLVPMASDNFNYRLRPIPAVAEETKPKGSRHRFKPRGSKPKGSHKGKPAGDKSASTASHPDDGGNDLPPMPEFDKIGGTGTPVP